MHAMISATRARPQPGWTFSTGAVTGDSYARGDRDRSRLVVTSSLNAKWFRI